MPSLNFVLPHWLYWLSLILVPLVAVVVIRRGASKDMTGKTTLPIAYFLWLTAGFIGIHRFYLRSALGAVFIPIFVAILFGNVEVREAKDAISGAHNSQNIAEFKLERAQKRLDQGREGAGEELAEAKRLVAAAEEELRAAESATSNANRFVRIAAGAIAALLLLDAILLPGLYRRCLAKEEAERGAREPIGPTCAVLPQTPDPTRRVHTLFTDAVDAVNGFAGQLVAYWSIIAVFVYYYEVLARYVFNSPTNWAHESMFLMFGMQYLLAGGYVLRENGHVRVDVIYMRFSDRTKALVDVITSAFFFIFAGVMIWTGWTFFMDSAGVWEVSFTEWAIQYWPVKLAIPLGAALLMLQGLARLIKDIEILRKGDLQGAEA